MKHLTRRQTHLLLGVAIMVVAALACGGGEAPAPTSEPVPPTPTIALTEPTQAEPSETAVSESDAETEQSETEATLKLVPTEDGSAVEVWVYGIEGLYALDLELTFEPGTLDIADVDDQTEGIQIEAGEVPVADFVVANNVDDVEGKILYTVAQIAPREPFDGDGLVATIALQENVDDVEIVVSQALLADKSGGEIAILTP